MQFTYYFFSHLLRELHAHLDGSSLVEAYSQEKDELRLAFASASAGSTFHWVINFQSELSHFHFPENLHRASNSASLFEQCRGQIVTDIQLIEGDRSLLIKLENGNALLFRLYGSRGNVLLLSNDGLVLERFRKNLDQDSHLHIEELSKLPTNETLTKPDDFLMHNPLLDKHMKEVLKQRLLESKEENYPFVYESFINELTHAEKFFVLAKGHKVILSFFEQMEGFELLVESESPLEASNLLHRYLFQVGVFEKERSKMVALLEKELLRLSLALEKQAQELEKLASGGHFSQWADSLMASLHTFSDKDTTLSFVNLYTGEEINLSLKEDERPIDRANLLYRKAKNIPLQIKALENTIASYKSKQAKIELELSKLKGIAHLKELRKWQHQNAASANHMEQESVFKIYHCEGYVVYVGRNAKNNDLLTLKEAKKDDYWLHAKDVAGSHVVIKHKAGKVLPKTVKAFAASLAAKFSKRKQEALVPVIFTQKKFVRKRKGDPAGAVVVEKEEVLLASPYQEE